MKKNKEKTERKTTFHFDVADKYKIYKGEKIKLHAKNINKLYNVIARNILTSGVNINGYTEISSSNFKQELSNYSYYINTLLAEGVIQRDRYVIGKKPFGYRFSEDFKSKMKINRITYVQKKRYKSSIQNNNKQNTIDQYVNERLYQDFKSCEVEFDLSINQIPKSYDSSGKYIDIGKWFSNNINLYRWRNGYYNYMVKSSRLYSNFTFLSGYLRSSAIKLKNETLKEIDIPNSFPLFISILISKYIKNATDNYDFQQYCTHVVHGTFYNFLTLKLNELRNCDNTDLNKDSEKIYRRLLSRKEVKEIFQIYLNGRSWRKPYLHGQTPYVNEVMEKHFPIVHEFIMNIKNDKTNVNSKSALYNLVVKTETDFIMGIAKELYSNDSETQVYLVSCHDALYCIGSQHEIVYNVYRKHMDNLIKGLVYEKKEEPNGCDLFVKRDSKLGDEIFVEESTEVLMEEKEDYRTDDYWNDVFGNSEKEDMDYSDIDEENSDFEDWYSSPE